MKCISYSLAFYLFLFPCLVECTEEKPTPLSNIQDEDTSSMGSQAKDLLELDDEKLSSVTVSISSKVEPDEETQQQAPLLSPKTELDEACAAAAFLETSSSQAVNISESSNVTPAPLIQPKTDVRKSLLWKKINTNKIIVCFVCVSYL